MPQDLWQPPVWRQATAARTGYVPPAGAVVLDTTTLTLYVGDGVTAGGVALGVDAARVLTGQLLPARGGTGVDASAAANGKLLIGNGSGFTLANLTAGANVTITNSAGGVTIAAAGGGGSGTVTSVGLSLPAELTVSGSPVTSSGTLTAAWASQSANLFHAAPDGSSGTPSFRAIAHRDLPRTVRGYKTGGALYFMCQQAGSATSSTLSNNTLYMAPVLVPHAVTVASLLVEVVTTAGNAGSTIRLGIYADNGSYPGALVLDAGTVAADSTGVKEATFTQALAPGLYWFGCVIQGAATTVPTVRTNSTVAVGVDVATGTSLPANLANFFHSYAQNAVSGALPSNFSTSVVASTAMPRLAMKIT